MNLTNNAADEIAKLAALRESGDITMEEFQSAKSNLLDPKFHTDSLSETSKSVTRDASEQPSESKSSLAKVVIIVVVVALIGGALFASVVIGKKKSRRPISISNSQAAVACNTDAKTIQTAVGAYNADPPQNQTISSIGVETGITPGVPSTYGTGVMASILTSTNPPGPYISIWPSDINGYALSLSTTVAGDVSIYIPPNNPNPVSYQSESANSGCNSL